MLSNSFAAANHVLEMADKTASSSIFGTGGDSKRLSARIDGLQLGTSVLRPQCRYFTDVKEGALASPDIGAIAGGEILRRFTVTFDYPHHRILLEPNL